MLEGFACPNQIEKPLVKSDKQQQMLWVLSFKMVNSLVAKNMMGVLMMLYIVDCTVLMQIMCCVCLRP